MGVEMSTPTIAEIRALAKKHNLNRAILIYTIEDDTSLGYTSYGRDRKTCQSTAVMADKVYDFVKGLYGISVE